MDMGLQPDGTVVCIYSPLPNVSCGLIKLLLKLDKKLHTTVNARDVITDPCSNLT